MSRGRIFLQLGDDCIINLDNFSIGFDSTRNWGSEIPSTRFMINCIGKPDINQSGILTKDVCEAIEKALLETPIDQNVFIKIKI